MILWIIRILNAADAWTTLLGVAEMGLGAELNPAMRWLLHMGSWWFVLGKVGICELLCRTMGRLEARWPERIVAAILAGVVLNNIVQEALWVWLRQRSI
jgi:hypothetical protein